MRTTALLLLMTLAPGLPVFAQNDIENVIVETYYISDANDATDTIGGGLVEGSTTYRVYIDLCDSCALRSIYGDVNHALRVSSTAVFFNNLDRGKTFGHEIADNRLDENTVALDSWFSMGAASTLKFGVLKPYDTDGTILSPNDGGSLPVPTPGLLQNADADAGLPLTQQDGLLPLNGASAVPPSFSVTGIQPSTVFNDSTLFNAFVSNNTRVACVAPGVKGPTADNRILIAQLTTTGDLTFALNVEVERADGTVQKYVASDSALQVDETANGLLVYPPLCGCTDPNFLEFDPTAGCDDGSCATAIVFGCLDTVACNFDASANFNITALCCYGPDSCNGLDVTLVCPGVWVPELRGAMAIDLHPNPATSVLHIRGLDGWSRGSAIRITVCDALGRVVSDRTLDTMAGYEEDVPVSALSPGAYLLRLTSPQGQVTRSFIRE